MDTPSATAAEIGLYDKDKEWQRCPECRPVAGKTQQFSLESAGNGAFCLYKNKAGFGMMAGFRPGRSLMPRIYLNPHASQINLEIMTPLFELKKAESYTLRYEFEFLSSAPVHE